MILGAAERQTKLVLVSFILLLLSLNEKLACFSLIKETLIQKVYDCVFCLKGPCGTYVLATMLSVSVTERDTENLNKVTSFRPSRRIQPKSSKKCKKQFFSFIYLTTS